MQNILFGLVVFIGLAGAGLGSLAVYHRFAEQHRRDETISVIRMIASLFVVMTSLVLGLMTNSAKEVFDGANQNLDAYAAQFILLDRALHEYGADADAARRPIAAYLRAVLARSDPGTPITVDQTLGRLLDEIGVRLNGLNPTGAVQTALWQEARDHLQRIDQLRWTMAGQAEGTIPMPMIVMLVAWLMLIFGSFGFCAPRNGLVTISLVVAAALISASIYLITDMDMPFDGPIQISIDPIQFALTQVSR